MVTSSILFAFYNCGNPVKRKEHDFLKIKYSKILSLLRPGPGGTFLLTFLQLSLGCCWLSGRFAPAKECFHSFPGNILEAVVECLSF